MQPGFLKKLALSSILVIGKLLMRSADMARMVNCVVLKRQAEGLEKPPHPGELGERIFQHVSREGWNQWLERLTTIINENGLSTADIENIRLIERHMLGFLFGEGDMGQLPSGYRAAGGSKK